MEGYETDYAPEEPADQEETITEPEPEELETEPEEQQGKRKSRRTRQSAETTLLSAVT